METVIKEKYKEYLNTLPNNTFEARLDEIEKT